MRTLLLCILSLLVIIIAGYDKSITSYRNIDEIIFARVLAVDKSTTDSNNVRITASYQMPAGEGSGNSFSKNNQSAVISSEGKTLSEAVRNFNSFSDKKIFLGQVDFILFSEDTGIDGLLQYIDFFTRYYEVNLNTSIFIVKEASAEELLKAAGKNESSVSKYLKNLLENSRALSVSGEIKLKNIVRTLNKSHISAHLPSLKLRENSNHDSSKIHIEMDGYAIFKGDKLAGYLTSKKARGFNWITNQIMSGTILVKGKDGKDISLEINSSKRKIEPLLDNDNLTITVYVDMSSNISEQTSMEDIYNEQALEDLKRQQEQIILEEIGQVLDLAKEKKADIFGIGDIVYHKYPIQWQELKNSWPETFSNLPIDIEVASEIKRTYILNQPTGNEMTANK